MLEGCRRGLAVVMACGSLAACDLPYQERSALIATWSPTEKYRAVIGVCDATYQSIREVLSRESSLASGSSPARDSPDALRDNKVVQAVMHGILRRKTIGMRAVVISTADTSVAAQITKEQLFGLIGATTADSPGVQKAKLQAALDRVIEQRPGRISRQDFQEFFDLLGVRVGQAAERVLRYEAAYLNGEFVDRFGRKWDAPKPSWTVTDDQISEVMTVILEAVADEIFIRTPVWIDDTKTKPATPAPKPGGNAKAQEDGPTYYPGGKKDKPTFLDFAERYSSSAAGLTRPMDSLNDPTCGMTKLKMDALIFLSNRASTLAAGQSGLLLGAFGGTTVGLPIVMGKLSIGDNQTLQALFKALVAYIAKRGAYEASWHLLLHINEKEIGSLGDILNKVVLKPGDDDDKDDKPAKPKG